MNFENYQTLTLNGQMLTGLEITEYCKNQEAPNLRLIGLFVSEWLSDKPFVEVKTSGSTGVPKIISVEKNQMLQSAAMTAAFFGFAPGQTALLCLPMNYIAGKMMVVRAMLSGLNLHCIEPENNPLQHLRAQTVIDFAPLIPMQLEGVTNTGAIKKILLGGSAVNPIQEEHFNKLEAEIYHGYGMTETLSHVAIRAVNGSFRSDVFKALPGIYFDTDERDCLLIDIPFFRDIIYTNDVVELIDDQQFIWRGRADNVINSGGIKLFPEEVERKLMPLMSGPFFVAGIHDERFGEKLCLFIEGMRPDEETFDRMKSEIALHLDRYEKPRDIFYIPSFVRTGSGKIKRKETVYYVLGFG